MDEAQEHEESPRHRGRHPKDDVLFGPSAERARLRSATADLSWMLTRRYGMVASLKHVGDRYALRERQRNAVARSACADDALARRRESERSPEDCVAQELVIDAFNLIILIESALSGAFLFEGRDGCVRDLASVHGSYKKVHETEAAIALIGETVAALRLGPCHFILDAPVSNSGRLKELIMSVARNHGWTFSAETSARADERLATSGKVVVTTDSGILDRGVGWLNLGRRVIERMRPPPLSLLSLAGHDESGDAHEDKEA